MGEEEATMREKPYTAEWVKQKADEMGALWLNHHQCAICESMVGYSITGDDVAFNSGCDCGWSPPRTSSFQDIANWLAMQSSDEIRDRIMRGLRKW